jgi:glycine cleavage system H protein
VIERNAMLDERPELVNDAPYGDGWLVLIEMSAPVSLEALLDASTYRTFIERSP